MLRSKKLEIRGENVKTERGIKDMFKKLNG
jgi:hypothetical protein